MQTIVHLSDLHFGALNDLTIGPLVDTLAGLRPDAVVVSGDLTQRARRREFVSARAFLERLPAPRLVVPGNHDVPLHNPIGRFWHRLRRYREYITDDLEPFWANDDVAIAGINTARSATIKGGRVSDRQVTGVVDRFRSVPAGVTRIVVAHHPFDLPPGPGGGRLVGRAARAMEHFAQSGIDVFLTGHLHKAHTGSTAERYRIPGHSALVVQAGTATSTRGRGEANSFNVLRVDRTRIVLDRFIWDISSSRFDLVQHGSFTRAIDGWKPESDRVDP